MVLCLATLKMYDYVSDNAGKKLSQQIDDFKKVSTSYPTDFITIKENTDLNLIEEIFSNRVQYEVNESNYELRTINLLNMERTYDKDLEEWN